MPTNSVSQSQMKPWHRRLLDWIGPRIYKGYVPHRLQIPLRDVAKHLSIPIAQLHEVWIESGLLRVRTQFSGPPFTTRADVEAAVMNAGLRPCA